MKTVEIKVPVKVGASKTIEIVSTYQEIENLEDLANFEISKTVSIFNQGLRAATRNKVKSDNNYQALIARLLAAKVFNTEAEAVEFILAKRNSVNP